MSKVEKLGLIKVKNDKHFKQIPMKLRSKKLIRQALEEQMPAVSDRLGQSPYNITDEQL